MPAPRMNQGNSDFWASTLGPGLLGLRDHAQANLQGLLANPLQPYANAAASWMLASESPQIRQQLADSAALGSAAVPGYGDLIGLGADAHRMAFFPEERTAVNMGLAGAGLLPFMPHMGAITTWHGSPHQWDKPDISKVGTGEGAQAYGHGFYSTDTQDIAKRYRDDLSSFRLDVEGGGWDSMNPRHRAVEAGRLGDPIVAASRLRQDADAMEKYLRSIDGWELPSATKDFIARDRAAADILEAEGVPKFEQLTTGNLYKLDIPDEDVAKYLDWDKPLSEQPEAFALLKTKFPYLGYAGHKNGDWALGEIGEGIGGMSARLSQELSDAGIPGIRYLDGSSRSAGEGTYNYVTFDPSRISVLERNGKPIK